MYVQVAEELKKSLAELKESNEPGTKLTVALLSGQKLPAHSGQKRSAPAAKAGKSAGSAAQATPAAAAPTKTTNGGTPAKVANTSLFLLLLSNTPLLILLYCLHMSAYR